ncbi:MAG: flagellar motor switch protein FliG [Planctomycetota bacterium]|nr:MAG: flagellar motor switch protein FliG [Planctomycetota bacterium]REJ97423.1 MAG: flagellar motor switch protein FliG [Planctomycetota bacterium]REK27665.1 MAG: flagellar motor switch protein FliG [Planctomycetota bacterium]REK38492.1 MAG: flagellar motor switch protein FliG [Planctomycetota bacterium]
MSTDIRKAAVLLTSLPPDTAGDLLGRLDAKLVEAVSIEIAKLDHVSGPEMENVAHEFAEANPHAFGGEGGMKLAEALMERALGKDAHSTIDTVRQSIEALPFGFLKNVDSQNLLTFIIDEHPQTIALILSHLPAGQGAEILAGLPTERQLSVIRRVATMGQTNPEIIQEVEHGLETRMASVMSQQFENAGGVPCVAEILNVTDRTTERSLLENLAQEDPDLVEEIRRLMFVFEDIGKLTDRDIQTVLKNVENSQWAMALKGASDLVQEKILGNLSQRAGELLKEEMEYLGPVKVSSVEQVQQQIVDIVRRLEDAGEITVQGADEAEEMIT